MNRIAVLLVATVVLVGCQKAGNGGASDAVVDTTIDSPANTVVATSNVAANAAGSEDGDNSTSTAPPPPDGGPAVAAASGSPQGSDDAVPAPPPAPPPPTLSQADAVRAAIDSGRDQVFAEDGSTGTIHVAPSSPIDGQPCRSVTVAWGGMPGKAREYCRGDDGRWTNGDD